MKRHREKVMWQCAIFPLKIEEALHCKEYHLFKALCRGSQRAIVHIKSAEYILEKPSQTRTCKNHCAITKQYFPACPSQFLSFFIIIIYKVLVNSWKVPVMNLFIILPDLHQ